MAQNILQRGSYFRKDSQRNEIFNLYNHIRKLMSHPFVQGHASAAILLSLADITKDCVRSFEILDQKAVMRDDLPSPLKPKRSSRNQLTCFTLSWKRKDEIY